MRVVRGVIAAVLAVALLFPPWRVTWAPVSTAAGPTTVETTWAGFHFWMYAGERPTKVIAWDGPGTGGHTEFTGTPRIAFDIWAGILLFSAAGLYLVNRRINSPGPL